MPKSKDRAIKPQPQRGSKGYTMSKQNFPKEARRKARKAKSNSRNSKRTNPREVNLGGVAFKNTPEGTVVDLSRATAEEAEETISLMGKFKSGALKQFDINPDHGSLKVNAEVISHYEERNGKKIEDVTPLLPEATIPIAMDEALIEALSKNGDFDNMVFDTFHMSVNAPRKVRRTYSTYFVMSLMDAAETDIVVCATQFGHEPCLVFTLAGDDCSWYVYGQDDEVKALFQSDRT